MSKQANLFPLYIQRTAPAERNHFSGLPKQVERANMQGIRAGKPTSNRPDIAPAGFGIRSATKRPQKA